MIPCRITDLEAEFVRWEDRREPRQTVVGYDTSTPEGSAAWHAAGCPTVEEVCDVTYMHHQDVTFADAQGILMNCPVCADGHSISIAFRDRGALPHHGTRDKTGNPTRWAASGTGLHDLTLSPSVDCTPSNPKCWHGFITNGNVT